MAYFLGIDVGAVRTVAAVARPGSDDVEIVDLGDGTDSADGGADGVASVLHLGADGVLAVGAAAQRWALVEPDHVVDGFPGRVGDDAMMLAGEPWAPEELTAWLVRWVVDRVADGEGGPATAVAVSHPAWWDADRIRPLADAVAEQELEVAFLTPPSHDALAPNNAGEAATVDPSGDTDDTAGERGGGAAAAREAARALRAAAAVTAGPVTSPSVVRPPGSVDAAGSGRHTAVGHGRDDTTTTPDADDGGGSGRHLVVGGAIAALAGVGPTSGAEGDDPPDAEDAGPDDDINDIDDRPDDHAVDDPPDDTPDDTPDDDADTDEPAAGGTAADRGWDVPSPRRPGSDGPPADPATANLVADLVGFTGGMGATNTAGLLSGYTPPHGMPSSWSGGGPGGQAATAAAGTATATGSAVALPAQRSHSGRWTAVAPEAPASTRDRAPAVGARTNPTVLVGAGGLAAAVAVVATLFLWPAPRTTNSAVRPVAAIPAATTADGPTASVVSVTPEPTPTHRARPVAPRTRRPVVPPVTAPVSTSETTPQPTDSTEPTTPTTSTPPSSEPTEPTTTTTTKKPDHD